MAILSRAGARWIVEHKGYIVGAMLLVVGAFAIGVPRIRADFSPQALFATVDREQQLTEEFREVFGSTESVYLLLLRGDDVLSRDALQYAHDVGLMLQEQEWSTTVDSATLTPIARSDAPGSLNVSPLVNGDTVEQAEVDAIVDQLARSSMLEGALVSEERDIVAVAARMTEENTSIGPLRTIADDLRAWRDANPPPAGVDLVFTGIPELRSSVVNAMFTDQLTLVPISMLICILLLYLCFRWFPGVFAPMFAVAGTGAIVIGGMGWAGVEFNIINQVLPVLVMVIGVSDSIHLVNRYGEELRRTGGERREAAIATLQTMAGACFLTSFTTAIGFASLYVARSMILRGFGVAAACSMMAAYLVTILLVLPMLTWFRAPDARKFVSHDGLLERISVGMVSWVSRHARAVLVASLLVVAGSVAVATQVVVDSNLTDIFRPNHPTLQEIYVVEEQLEGVIPIELSLSAPDEGAFDDPELLNAVDRIADWVVDEEHVLGTNTYSDYLHEAWAAYTDDPTKRDQPFASRAQVAQLYALIESAEPDPTEAYVTFDRTQLRLQIQVEDMGGRATLALGERILERTDEELTDFESVNVHLTGDGYSASRGVNSIMRDMMASLGLAFVIIFVIMTILFRSLRFGLITVPPNIIPLILTLAWMGARGIYLNSTTSIIFSISLGLAVDDTIHFLARFREERRGGVGRDDAILSAAAGTGRAILVTTVMLGAGLMVLLGSSFVPIALFAELIAVTLLACVFGDLIVLPALLKVATRE